MFGGHHNRELNEEMLGLCGKVKQRITYVPSCCLGLKAKQYYEDWKATFETDEKVEFDYWAIDREYGKDEKVRALSSDIIYLSGGDTHYFWEVIKKNKLDRELANFADRGGVLAGLSAGAIIMSPYSGVLKILKEEDRGVKMMGLVDFEVLPHYEAEKHEDKLKKYAKTRPHPVIGLTNDSAVSIDDKSIKFIGPATIFNTGKLRLNGGGRL